MIFCIVDTSTTTAGSCVNIPGHDGAPICFAHRSQLPDDFRKRLRLVEREYVEQPTDKARWTRYQTVLAEAKARIEAVELAAQAR